MDIHKALGSFGNGANILMRYLLIIGMVSGLAFQFVFAQGATTPGTPGGNISSVLCSIINTVKAVIGILALAMFILGGALYGIAHFLPAAGNLRSGAQGWGMGMIMAGFIAFIIYLLAGYIVTTLVGFANAQVGAISNVGSLTCPQ